MTWTIKKYLKKCYAYYNDCKEQGVLDYPEVRDYGVSSGYPSYAYLSIGKDVYIIRRKTAKVLVDNAFSYDSGSYFFDIDKYKKLCL